MPDRTKLKAGDAIKLLSVPESDLKERAERVYSEEDILPTATVIEMAIEQYGVVFIDHIDEHNQPWFSVDINVDGEIEHHLLAILDDHSWTTAR